MTSIRSARVRDLGYRMQYAVVDARYTKRSTKQFGPPTRDLCVGFYDLNGVDQSRESLIFRSESKNTHCKRSVGEHCFSGESEKFAKEKTNERTNQ